MRTLHKHFKMSLGKCVMDIMCNSPYIKIKNGVLLKLTKPFLQDYEQLE